MQQISIATIIANGLLRVGGSKGLAGAMVVDMLDSVLCGRATHFFPRFVPPPQITDLRSDCELAILGAVVQLSANEVANASRMGWL